MPVHRVTLKAIIKVYGCRYIERSLLLRMIDNNPSTRITAKEALTHPYF